MFLAVIGLAIVAIFRLLPMQRLFAPGAPASPADVFDDARSQSVGPAYLVYNTPPTPNSLGAVSMPRDVGSLGQFYPNNDNTTSTYDKGCGCYG